MKKQILRTLSLILAAVLLLMCLPATAEQTKNKTKDKTKSEGTITLIIGSDTSEYTRSGIVLNAYLIATGKVYGGWLLESPYKDMKLLVEQEDEDRTGSTWIDDSLKQLHARIRTLGIRPSLTVTSNKDGIAEFNVPQRGVYYIEMAKGPDYLSLKPMLLSVPNEAGSVQYYSTAKGSYNPPTPMIKNPPPAGTGRHYENIDEYETALGLGNIQMHVGVCFE